MTFTSRYESRSREEPRGEGILGVAAKVGSGVN